MFLSHHSELSGQRSRSTGHIGEPFDHPVELEPAIEPVSEGAKVAPEMLPVNGVILTVS